MVFIYGQNSLWDVMYLIVLIISCLTGTLVTNFHWLRNVVWRYKRKCCMFQIETSLKKWAQMLCVSWGGWKASRWFHRLVPLTAKICVTVISKDPAQDRNVQGERGEEPFARQKSRDKGYNRHCPLFSDLFAGPWFHLLYSCVRETILFCIVSSRVCFQKRHWVYVVYHVLCRVFLWQFSA